MVVAVAVDAVAKQSSMVQSVWGYGVKYSRHLPQHSQTVYTSQGEHLC